MTEFTRGMLPEQAREAAQRFVGALRGESDIAALDEMGDIAALKGVAGLPVRVKCATLAWHALLKALAA
jgi:nitrogen fixation NifU-like protein